MSRHTSRNYGRFLDITSDGLVIHGLARAWVCRAYWGSWFRKILGTGPRSYHTAYSWPNTSAASPVLEEEPL
jgi:hypothetical protein